MNTLLLLDGHSLAFRSFFALPAESFKTAQGKYTNAVHGFLSTLLSLAKKYQPTHVAVAFDLPGGTFRTREYSEYKGGRVATPEEFKGQIELIQEVLDALGVMWLTKEDFEADDIVATLATRGEAEHMRVYVASGDKDSYQLVNDNVTVLYPMPRSVMLEMTPDVVKERTGVFPQQYPDMAALVGEGADNLPGVPGVGKKTAEKWITTYGGLSEIIAHAGEIKGKVGERLRENLQQVKLNRALNELVRDLDIVPDMAALEIAGAEPEKVHELFDVLDFTQLRTRVFAEWPTREGTAPIVADAQLREAKVVADTEFSDFVAAHCGPYALFVQGVLAPARGRIDEFAIAATDGATFASSFGELTPTSEKTLATWLADPGAKKIGHGTKGISHAFAGEGMMVRGWSVDTEIDAYLLHPDQRKYDLDELAMRYLGLELAADDGALFALDGSAASIAPRAVAVLDLAEALGAQLDQQEGSDALRDLEMLVSRVLTDMEARGIAVDEAALEDLRAQFDARVGNAASAAWDAIGDDSVNLSSPKQLQAVLFDQLGLPKTKKTKSGYTTNAEALEGLLAKIANREDADGIAGQNFLAALLEHRDAIKLRQSVEGLLASIQDDRRIHTTYQQTVAATGRLSSTDPNLQNIHARTEEGLQIRSVFVPGQGYESLMTADYSQIEMRLMAHLSGDESLIEAFNQGADLHSFVASRVFHIPQDQVTPAQRSKIKAMSYGLVYGLSAYGLSAQLRISVPEAQNLMDQYFSRFGKVKSYLDSLVVQARKVGYTETIMGRRRYLPELTATNRQVREAAERMALNAPIQGSAADLMKVAMLNTEEALRNAGVASRILLQVHDELVLEIAPGEAEQVEQIVREQMGSAFELSVPLSVGVGIGPDWRSAAH
ncbi:DNA polymerase-1 [Arcanobacterium wilhelmae]|uniref:DNA polymerase I n=1 Tax=Arcanobacterium wilhelmae TaxID=1803177 RepID=A0ABT9N8Y7_9ACTO|nr:DNA polymerase I [Arcanobacterium wilhelmae]MDP9799980.1 DNA polymerase-1 [Arcanobacterium wilhelmae]WFN89481.1 DNA polymerase I [Arcanobacterium wilhelmae]